MEEKLAAAPKEALVEIVKLVQKRGMLGEKGGWKDFLKFYDKQLGTSLSDPAKRSKEALLAFLNTFKEKADLEMFAKMLQCFSNRAVAKELLNSKDNESPEQRLVRLTYEQPQYPIEYSFPSHEEDWIITKPSKKHKGKPLLLLAVDCEMVLCEDGSDALVKICVVDRNLQVKLLECVKPEKTIVDFRTAITGVSADDLNGVTKSLADIQKSMKKLLSHGAILVGHGLSNDLRALKIDHPIVIDTSLIFNYGPENLRRRPSLNDLCKFVLGCEVRVTGATHNCQDDACAAMKIVLAKLENQIDDILPMVEDNVPEDQMTKLLLHRIPSTMPIEGLRQIIHGDYTIEVQKSKNGRGDRCSALLIFKTPQEACHAFENVQGDEQKDSSGRPQKSIIVQLSSGSTDTIYIRKMSCNSLPLAQVMPTNKRPFPFEENTVEKHKVSKTDGVTVGVPYKNASCVGHIEEIEWLKKMLSHRDEEISNLHKIIAALTRKQGL